MRIFGCVPGRRAIAAKCNAACLARSQMYPIRLDLSTFFAVAALPLFNRRDRVEINQALVNRNRLSQILHGISKISTCLAMPRSERFSGVAAMPFDRNSFEALLSAITRLVAKMERDVARP